MRGEPQAGLRQPGGGCHPGLNSWAPAPRDVAWRTPVNSGTTTGRFFGSDSFCKCEHGKTARVSGKCVKGRGVGRER